MIFVIGFIILIIRLSHKRLPSRQEDLSIRFHQLYEILGGQDNINRASVTGSRTKFNLEEISKCDFEALKKQFINGIFISGNAVTINCGFDTTEMVHQINQR